MIRVKPSPLADTRTCDFANVSREQLYQQSEQHIDDVRCALMFFGGKIAEAAQRHDFDKLTDIETFHRDFVAGFADGHTTWWDTHRRINRHHLTATDGVRDDVNLIDVLDYIADCVMAGMARSGSVTELALAPDFLERAFQNTVTLLKGQVVLDAPKEATDAQVSDAIALAAARAENRILHRELQDLRRQTELTR